MTSQKCGCTAATCGCCEGTHPITPVSEVNRPGLSALTYRVGTHGAFLETMMARLAAMTVAAPGGSGQTTATYSPLLGLTTRDPGDPAIALLDACATVGDVLTFYQERIANEGYLRTATERRSILELARLIGYALRPGVAASVYLAYTLDANQTDPVVIPAGTASQSIPGPGELPQTFETSDDLTARTAWNNLQPRMTQPQLLAVTGTSIDPTANQLNTATVYFQGTKTNLNPNDLLLFQVSGVNCLCHVGTVTADFTNNLTTVTLQEAPAAASAPTATPRAKAALSVKPVKEVSSFTALDNLLKGNLANPPAVQVAGSAFLTRNVSDALTLSSDTLPQILSVLKPAIAPTLYAAWANSATTIAQPAQVFAFRVKASPFGSVAPLKPITNAQGAVTGTEEWPIADTTIFGVEIANSARGGALLATTVATAGFTLNGQTQKAAVTFPVAPATTATTQLGNNASVVVSGPAADGSFAFAFSLPSSANVATPTINIFPLTANATQQVQINQDASVSVSVGHPNTYSTTAYAATVRLSIEASALTVEVAVPLLDVMFLDAQYSQIQQNTYAAIMRSDNSSTLVSNVTGVQNIAKAAYGITGKSTRLTLDQDWLSTLDTSLAVMRGTTVYAQSEQLTLAQQPYDPDSSNNPADVKGTTIELDDLYDGLTSGRWIIVSGERTDVLDANGNVVPGITASELAMIAGVTQSFNPKLPGDQIHTTITLATALAYTYSRSTVTVYGNVVDATNGATTNETMGSGDGSQELQSFALKQPPLTFVAAPTPAGAASTLEVYVNNVQWQEVDTLAGLGPKDRNFVTQTDDNAITTVIFGDGTQGARLPTGVGNVQAVYRKGIGQPGNVAAGEITMLTSPPLGVQSVLNPLDASGGADSDDIDQARANAPVAVLSLDRLVSVQDYADFSRTFAGIGKAASVRLSDGLRELVFITIAGADDVPIATTSDLYNNLLAALVNYGDPALPVQVGVRALKLMVISANVGLLSDYQWDSVALAIRTALLSAFSFTTIDLATPVRLSEVISVMQAVGGVEYVDILSFGSIPENFTASDLAKLTAAKKVGNSISSLPARSGTSSTAGGSAAILPAQLVYLSPAVPDTLILNQII